MADYILKPSLYRRPTGSSWAVVDDDENKISQYLTRRHTYETPSLFKLQIFDPEIQRLT